MSEQEKRDHFASIARVREPFKLLQFHRFANGEFVELAAEMAYIGFRMGLEVANTDSKKQ